MSDPQPTSLRELAGFFLRLGFTAFGGPAAHIALIEDQTVLRRRWLDRQHFLDLVAAINFIPGPNSTELVIHIGQLRAGTRGLIVAGICFIVPAMLIILPLSWMYVQWGALPQAQPTLHAIGAAVAAVVIFVTIRFAATALKDGFTITLAVAVLVAAPLVQQYSNVQPQIPLLILAAIAGLARNTLRPNRGTLLSLALPLGYWPQLAKLAWEMLKIGGTLFGSGYVLISYLQTSMVDYHGWMTPQQLSDAIAVGQFTPGPLLTTATFVGFLLGATTFGGGTAGGIIGGIVATATIFLPSFILVWIVGPAIQRIRANPNARQALNAMNAAVVVLMAIAAFELLLPAVYNTRSRSVDWLGLAIFLASLLGLWRQINATWLILAAALIGAVSGQFLIVP